MEDVGLEFEEDALRSIAKLAMERKTGARGLRSIVERCLLDTMYALPDLKGVTKVVINKEVVEKGEQPKLFREDAANISNKAHSPKRRVPRYTSFFLFF